MEMRPLDGAQMQHIANWLAWSNGTFDEAVMIEFGIDVDSLDTVMKLGGYEWDYDRHLWTSTREIWDDWDGRLPSG